VTNYVDLIVHVLVDDGGDYVAVEDGGDLAERFEERIGDVDANLHGYRRVKLIVKVPRPEMIELTGEVKVDESATGLTVG